MKSLMEEMAATSMSMKDLAAWNERDTKEERHRQLLRFAVVLYWKNKPLPDGQASRAVAEMVLQAMGRAASLGTGSLLPVREIDYGLVVGYGMAWQTDLSWEQAHQIGVKWGEVAQRFTVGEETLSDREVRIDLEDLGALLDLEVTHHG